MIIVVTGPTKIETHPLAVALADHLKWTMVDVQEQRESRPEAGAPARLEGAPPHRSDSLERLRELMLQKSERRESLILAAPPISQPEFVRLTDGLREVRVVGLRASSQVGADSAPHDGERHQSRGRDGHEVVLDRCAHITLDPSADIKTLVTRVRVAFGV